MTDFSNGGSLGLDLNSTDRNGVITNRLDFSVVSAAVGVAHKVMNVPAGFKVGSVVADVIVAQGAAATLTVGTSANADGYVVLVDANVVAMTTDTANAAEIEVGKLVKTADGIYFTPNLLLDAGVIRFSADVVNFAYTDSLI